MSDESISLNEYLVRSYNVKDKADHIKRLQRYLLILWVMFVLAFGVAIVMSMKVELLKGACK